MAARFARLGARFLWPAERTHWLWRQRRFVWDLTVGSIASRYRTSWFGLLWPVIHPVLLIGVFTFIFAYVMPLRWVAEESGGVGFPLFLYSGLVVYTLFAEAIGRAPGLMLENQNLVKKVVFPLEILVLVAVLASLLFFIVNFIVFSAMMSVFGAGAPLHAPLVLLLVFPFALLLAGLAWFLSALNVYVRDVAHVIGIVVTAMLFFSPVFYPLASAPEAVQPFLALNPMTTVIEGIRVIMLDHAFPSWQSVVLLWIEALVVFYSGLFFFGRVKEGFSDVL